MRYAWDQFDAYFGPAQVGKADEPAAAAGHGGAGAVGSRRRRAGSTAFVANSQYVAGRIRRYYNRGSTVVYPPVDTAFYRPDADRRPTRSGFLIVSALVPYKRLDVAIEACRRLGAPLKSSAEAPNERPPAGAWPDRTSTFLGWRSNEEIRELYRQADGRAAARDRGLRHGSGRGPGLRHARCRAWRRRRLRDGHRRRDRRPRRRRVQPRRSPTG